MAIINYVDELKNQRSLLVNILAEKNVEAYPDEKFNTLITKVKSIGGSKNVVGGIDRFNVSYIENAAITGKLLLIINGVVENFSLGELESVTFEEE